MKNVLRKRMTKLGLEKKTTTVTLSVHARRGLIMRARECKYMYAASLKHKHSIKMHL